MSHHNVDCCENTRGADALLDYYQNARNLVIDYMIKNPEQLTKLLWQQAGPLAIDNNCQCRMGKISSRSTFSCSQCRNLGRMVDLRNDDHKFMLEYGKLTGKYLNVITKDICQPFLSFDKSFCRYLPLCLNCVRGDNFTISILLNWFLQTNIHINKSLTAFICANKGFNLIESFNSFKDYTFDQVSAKSVVIQLIALLMHLNKFNFSLTNPSLNNLAYSLEPASYRVDNVVVSGPVTLKLVDFDNAAATFSGNHYFSHNMSLAAYLEKEIFLPNLIDDRNGLFKLTSDSLPIFLALKHFGYPIYPCALECYAFMIDLMRNESFAEIVRTDRWLNHFWHELWVENSYPNDCECGLKVMTGIWLKSDIVVKLWQYIKRS